MLCLALQQTSQNTILLGLYKKARAGEIRGFTGIDQPYEAPDSPEIVCKTVENTVEECMMQIVNYLEEFQIIPRNPAKVYPVKMNTIKFI